MEPFTGFPTYLDDYYGPLFLTQLHSQLLLKAFLTPHYNPVCIHLPFLYATSILLLHSVVFSSHPHSVHTYTYL